MEKSRQEELPYSKLLSYVDKGQVAEAVISDQLIVGTLTLKDIDSQQARRLIDVEARALVEEGHRRARGIIAEKQPKLDQLAAQLLEQEVISGAEVRALIGVPERSSAEPV